MWSFYLTISPIHGELFDFDGHMYVKSFEVLYLYANFVSVALLTYEPSIVPVS